MEGTSQCAGNIWDGNLQGRTAAPTLPEERAETLTLALERTLNDITFLWLRGQQGGGTQILFLVPDKLLGKWQQAGVRCSMRGPRKGDRERSSQRMEKRHSVRAKRGPQRMCGVSQHLLCGLHVVKDPLFLGRLAKERIFTLAAKIRSNSCGDVSRSQAVSTVQPCLSWAGCRKAEPMQIKRAKLHTMPLQLILIRNYLCYHWVTCIWCN